MVDWHDPELPAAHLGHHPQQISELVGDICDFLHNPEYEQEIQDAVHAAGLAARLTASPRQASALPTAEQQQPAPSTFQSPPAASSSALQDTGVCPGAGRAKAGSSSRAGANQQSLQMSNELKQEVESLLQRTDSILSRSSGHSTLHGASAGLMPGLTVNTGSGQGINTAALPQELAGFDFETSMQALDTPTFSKSGSREAGGSFTHRLTEEVGGVRGRRRTTWTPGGVDSTTGGRLSNSSERATPPIGSSSGYGYGYSYGYSSAGPQAGDAAGGGQPGSMQEEGGGFGGGSAGQGRLVTSLASRLSQQALSEIRDRLDGPEAASRFSSGYSGAEQTTVILGKSASWRQHNTAGTAGGGRVGAGRAGSLRAAGEGPGSGAAGSPIYANFAPLEQLVEATLTDAGANGGRGGWAGGGQQAAVVPRERGVSGGQGQPLSRAASSPTSHKLALGYMLQPDYILNSTLSRLKAELQGLSRAPLQAGGSVAGSSPFDVKLLALTARLSRWVQQELSAGETFQQLLDSILDSVFGRLSPGRGRVAPKLPTAAAAVSADVPQPPEQQHQQQPERASLKLPAGRHVSRSCSNTARKTAGPNAAAAAAAGSAAPRCGSSSACCGGWAGGSSNGGGSSSSMAAAAADATQRLSQAATCRTTRTDGSAASTMTAAAAGGPGPKPTDSMLRAAFVKLALGQAKLRQAVGGGPASPTAAAAGPGAGGGIPVDQPAAGGLTVLQPGIGVAQRLSCCSTSSPLGSSRQQSLAGELLAVAAAAQAASQAASTAAAAAPRVGAAAAAGSGSGSLVRAPSAAGLAPHHQSPFGTGRGARGSTALHSSSASSLAGALKAMPVRGVQPPAVAASGLGQHSPGRGRPALQQQQQQQCVQPLHSNTSASAGSLMLPGHRQVVLAGWSQPWLQQQQQQQQGAGAPVYATQQQQQQVQPRDASSLRSLEAAAAAQQEAWPSSSKLSRYSPGRDSLALARQAHKQRTEAAAAAAVDVGTAFQQQQQQLWDAGFVADSWGSPRRNSLFPTSPRPPAQQQQQSMPLLGSPQQQRQVWLHAAGSPPGRTSSVQPEFGAGAGSVGCRPFGTSSTAQVTAPGSPAAGAQVHSVRVSTAAAAAGGGGGGGTPGASGAGAGSSSSSPARRLRLPLTGGVLDVFADSVVVHSPHGSPILVDVLPCGN